MIYENAIDVINGVRTKKFRVTTSNGENKVMRLFVSASNSLPFYMKLPYKIIICQ